MVMQYFCYLDKREVLQQEYSHPTILPSPHFRWVVQHTSDKINRVGMEMSMTDAGAVGALSVFFKRTCKMGTSFPYPTRMASKYSTSLTQKSVHQGVTSSSTCCFSHSLSTVDVHFL